MLVKQVNDIGSKTLERCFGDFLDMLRAAVQTGLFAVFDVESEFGCDDDIFAEWRERLSNKLFVRIRPIHFCAIEERDSSFDSGADQRNSGLLVDSRA